MSDYETDVAVEPEGYDAVEPDGDESYDEYVDEPERDEAITGAVQEAIDQVFGRPEAAAAAQDGVEAAMPELSEEDISAANEAVDESFDELEQFYGAGFDRQAAFETATQTFNDLVDDGVDAGEAFEEAMRIGAEEAATVARGEPLVKRLVATERLRVPGADPRMVVHPHEAAVTAVAAAAKTGRLAAEAGL